jgi:histidyl-tRNA synthetase
LQVAQEFRAADFHVVTALDANISLGKQFKEADKKGIPYALVLGPEEVAEGMIVIKELASGEQHRVPRAEGVATLRRLNGL